MICIKVPHLHKSESYVAGHKQGFFQALVRIRKKLELKDQELIDELLKEYFGQTEVHESWHKDLDFLNGIGANLP